MNFILFTLILLTSAQENCGKPIIVNSIPYNTNITFGENVPLTTIKLRTGDTQVQAKYFQVEGTADTNDKLIMVDTCSLYTTVTTKIYVFSECGSEIASTLVQESGYDQVCSEGFNFPKLTFQIQQGKKYYVVIALAEADDQGTVVVNFGEDTTSKFDNGKCSSPIPIQELPFSTMQQIVNSKIATSQPECLDEDYHILWYRYVGTGKQVLISTCNYYTNVDTKIVVVKGDQHTASCSSLKCAAQGDDGCGTKNTATIMQFFAENSQIYFIGVYANNHEEGQFKIMVDYLSNNLPYVCPNAVPIQQLPFSYEIEISHDWPAERGRCFYTDEEMRSLYLTFTGTGSDVVFSTCKSMTSQLKAVGTAIELLSNCENMECELMNEEYGACGGNMYIVKHTEKDKKYVLRMYCTDTQAESCPLSINVYERSESHDTCENARTLENPGTYQEIVVVENIGKSAHGCSGKADSTDPGLWYKFIHTMEIDVEIYTVYAKSALGDEIGWIEMPTECNTNICSTQPTQGHVRLTMNHHDSYQYIFVYPDPKRGQQGLLVQFVNEIPQQYVTCENALEIQLPYTGLHTFEDTVNQMACTTIKAPANYYKFRLAKKQQVDISTCFAKTMVNTGVEIVKNKCPSEGGSCTVYKSESDGCAYGAVKMQHTLDKDTDYYLTIYSEATQALAVRQYRFVIFTEEVPENSMCATATELPFEDGYAEYLVLNRYGRMSNFGKAYGETRGSWFHIKVTKKMSITVRTCSPDTTTNSFIVLADECKTEGSGSQTVSTPSKLSNLAKSSEITCDIHGTYTTFELDEGEEKYIFVGPESFNTDCFIGAQFYMDLTSPEEDAEETEVNEVAVGYVVVGSICYVWAIVLTVLVTVIIVIRKRTSSYSALE